MTTFIITYQKELIMRFAPLFSIGALAAVSLLGCSNQSDTSSDDTATTTSAASQETTTLRFSHFWPATSNISKEIFEPWAKKIEDESGGRLKVELYPSAGLAKADVTYEATAKGTIDIGSQVQGYTAGRFPLTQITELPGLSNSAV